jgi:hypothetical protein
MAKTLAGVPEAQLPSRFARFSQLIDPHELEKTTLAQDRDHEKRSDKTAQIVG